MKMSLAKMNGDEGKKRQRKNHNNITTMTAKPANSLLTYCFYFLSNVSFFAQNKDMHRKKDVENYYPHIN